MPAWSSLLFTCFPCFPSRSHAHIQIYCSLTLLVVQVHAAALILECKSAWSTSIAHTFAYIRPTF